MESTDQPNGDILTVQQSLPNATKFLVLGILSIVFCFICGIVALLISNQDRKLYQSNPHLFSRSSYELVKAGQICSIVSLCLWACCFCSVIIFIFAFNLEIFKD
ncbi:MAG: hypothetical protein M3342_13915 [Bacteroidota bacterium]|nr:hypothetical protein [Bacteroidota bacterium]